MNWKYPHHINEVAIGKAKIISKKMDIRQLRSETAGCGSVIHLNNAGASLMPNIVVSAINRFLNYEEMNGGYEAADKKAAELDQFYINAGKLLNCSARNIAFTTNATDSYNKALSSIRFNKGDVILTTSNDYPSNFIAFLSLEKRYGVKTIVVRNTGTGELDLGDLETKLKQHSPKLLSVSHVPTSSGLVQPVEEIGGIVKDYETIYLLDACQSLGQMKVDALSTNADFISGTFRKFLRGPRGAGLLYVSDKALDLGLEPLFPDIRGADWISESQYRPQQSAKRFEDWETAFALMAGSNAALSYLLDLGIDNIEQRNKVITKYLRNSLLALNEINILDKGKRKCSIVTLSIPATTEKVTKEYFASKGINIYTSPKSVALIDFAEKNIDWALRVSPHYYNTEQEIDLFIDALKEMNKKSL